MKTLVAKARTLASLATLGVLFCACASCFTTRAPAAPDDTALPIGPTGIEIHVHQLPME